MKRMMALIALLSFLFVGIGNAQIDTQTVAGWRITQVNGNVESASTTIIDSVSQSFNITLQSYDDSAYVIWGKKLDRVYSIPAYDPAHPYSEFTVIGWDEKYEKSGPSSYDAFFSQLYFGTTSDMYPLQPRLMYAVVSEHDWVSAQSLTIDLYPNPTETMDSIALKLFTYGTYGEVDFRGIKIFYAHKDSVSGIGTVDSTVVINIFGDKTTAIDVPHGTIPQNFSLSQNYPNPFNPTTTINYSVPSYTHVSLKVYDVLGREVMTLVDEEKSVGNYTVKFDGSDLPSGTYFYRLQTDNGFVETKKMVLIK